MVFPLHAFLYLTSIAYKADEKLPYLVSSDIWYIGFGMNHLKEN